MKPIVEMIVKDLDMKHASYKAHVGHFNGYTGSYRTGDIYSDLYRLGDQLRSYASDFKVIQGYGDQPYSGAYSSDTLCMVVSYAEGDISFRDHEGNRAAYIMELIDIAEYVA